MPGAARDILYSEVAAGQAEPDTALVDLLDGIDRTLGDVYDLVRDTDQGPGWTALLSPARIPARYLPWLAQVAGVDITNLPEDQARQRIATPPAFERGTPQAIIEVTQRTLTGDRMVRLLERADGPYTVTVVTRTDETPNPAATLAAIRSQTPAGIVVTHVVSNAPIVNEGTLTIDAAAGDIDTATLDDVT